MMGAEEQGSQHMIGKRGEKKKKSERRVMIWPSESLSPELPAKRKVSI